jgi:hypothetical protein
MSSWYKQLDRAIENDPPNPSRDSEPRLGSEELPISCVGQPGHPLCPTLAKGARGT